MCSIFISLQIELIEDEKLLQTEDSKLMLNYEKMLDNSEWCDLSCVCSDGAKIFVNLSMIAIQCPALATMFTTKVEQCQTFEIFIENIDSSTMRELLRFIYCGKVNNIKEVALGLLLVANKYGIEDLKDICSSSLKGNLTEENVIEVLQLADACNHQNLRNNCINFIKW